MLKTRMEAARSVTGALRTFEEAIDTALIEGNAFSSSMIAARKHANLSPVVGQEALAKVAEALFVLTTARQSLVDAHNSLADVRDKMGLRVLATGDGGKLGEPPLTGANEGGVFHVERVAA